MQWPEPTGKTCLIRYGDREILFHNQKSADWTHPYGYGEEKSDLCGAGCGIFAIAHAVEWMTGRRIDVGGPGRFLASKRRPGRHRAPTGPPCSRPCSGRAWPGKWALNTASTAEKRPSGPGRGAGGRGRGPVQPAGGPYRVPGGYPGARRRKAGAGQDSVCESAGKSSGIRCASACRAARLSFG